MEWLDVETAPRDGTVIDIANPRGRECDVYWDDKYKTWRRGCAVFSDATHWMPIPDLPKENQNV